MNSDNNLHGSSNVAYFDSVAESWEDLRTEFYSVSLRETAFAHAGINRGKTAADVGAGSGFISEGLLNKGIRVTAVDHSDGMIAQLYKRFGDNELFSVKKRDSEKLPLEDNAVDYVFANMFLHHVESPKKNIEEMVRVVAPGGKLVITDLDAHQFKFLVAEHFDRWMGFDRREVHNWLTQSGLKNVVVTCTGESCTANAEKICDRATVSIFIATGEKSK